MRFRTNYYLVRALRQQCNFADGVPSADVPADQVPGDTVPADASADAAALDAKINEIAGGDLGANLEDERLVGKKETADDGATKETGEAGGDLPKSGDDGGDVSPDAGESDSEDAEGDEDTGQADADPEPPKIEPKQPEAKEYALTVKDEEGKEYKISKIEDLPEDFKPRNNRQILEIINNLNKLEGEKAADEAAAAERAASDKQVQYQKDVLKRWDSEIEMLQSEGMLDKPKVKPGDPKYLEDPGVKKVSEVFSYITKQNEARSKANLPLIESFTDAYKLMRLEQLESDKAQAEKDELDTARKKAGAVAGGGSRAGVAPQVYRAGQASEISDLL